MTLDSIKNLIVGCISIMGRTSVFVCAFTSKKVFLTTRRLQYLLELAAMETVAMVITSTSSLESEAIVFVQH